MKPQVRAHIDLPPQVAWVKIVMSGYVAEALSDHRRARNGTGNKTYTRFLATDPLGAQTLSTVTADDLRRVITRWKDAGAGNATISTRFRVVRALLIDVGRLIAFAAPLGSQAPG